MRCADGGERSIRSNVRTEGDLGRGTDTVRMLRDPRGLLAERAVARLTPPWFRAPAPVAVVLSTGWLVLAAVTGRRRSRAAASP